MQEFEQGNVVKTKDGDKAVIIENQGNKTLIFNITQTKPDVIDTEDIKEVIDDPSCKVTVEKNTIQVCNKVKKDEKICNEMKNNETECNDDEEDLCKEFGGILKTFGDAAISLGNIFIKMSAEADKE